MTAVPGVPVDPAAIGNSLDTRFIHIDTTFAFFKIESRAFAFASRWFTFAFVDNRNTTTV